MQNEVIIIAGWPGVGKTTLATQLQKDTGYILLNKDDLTRDITPRLHHILGLDPDDRESEIHTTVVRSMTHRMLYNAARCVLDSGCSVIMDTPFDQYITEPDWYSGMSAILGVEPTVIWIEIPQDAEYRQLVERKRSIDTWKIEHFEEYYAKRSGMHYEVPSQHFAKCGNSYSEVKECLRKMHNKDA